MKRSSHRHRATKADLRSDLNKDIEAFLSEGGQIDRFEPGETALEARIAPLRTPIFNEPRTERTPLDDVIATLDERRRSKLKRTPARKRSRKPQLRKRVVYDDFGEAIRTVWQEDS